MSISAVRAWTLLRSFHCVTSKIHKGFHALVSKRNVSYKSAISLETLYPKSSLKLTSPTFVPDPNEKFSGYIPLNQLDISYSCSSGPGGQNVNKVHTKVDLRFKVTDASWLLPEVREKLLEQHKTKITKEGYMVIKSEVTRSQQMNVADCLRKLRYLIRKAGEPEPQPSAESLERVRRRHERAARDRLAIKRHNSLKRDARKPPSIQDL